MVFVSSPNPISGHTKVTLPHEEAAKAPFPPGCKVLCFDENGFRVGVVKDVLVFISLHEEATYGTYYEVEIKGANLQVGKTSVFTAADLRLTPDCPVVISPEYFGSVFKNNESEGNIEGVVLGSFEIPPSRCSSRSNDKEHHHEIRRFFYSVRVRFPGMDEAVEAHGVPPEHVMVLPSGNENLPPSFLSDNSIIIGGGSYTEGMSGQDIDFLDEKRTKSLRGKPRRVTPEEMHDVQAEEDFGHDEGVRDGYYQEPYADEYSDASYPESPTRTPKRIHNIISNSESHFYDTGSESEIDRQPQILTRQMSNIPSSRGGHNDRSSDRRPKSRSVSRTRTYVRSQPPVRTKVNKIPAHDDNSLTQEYVTFKDKRESHSNSKRSRRSPTQENSKYSPQSTDYSDYEETNGVIDNGEGVVDARLENTDSYADHNSRNDPMSEEEYDSATFKESDDEFDNDKRESIGDTKTLSSPSYHDEISSADNQVYRAQTPTPRTEIQSNTSTRSATPVRKKAFGKTWTPTQQISGSGKGDEAETAEKPKIGKLHVASRGATPVRIRSSTPVPRANMTGTPLSVSKVPETIPKEGCYLLFDSNSGGRFITQFSHSVVQEAIGFWAPGPGKKLQGFKFKQNQGKSDLMKGVAGKDYKKKYYSGWCQYIKLAKSFNGFFVKYSEKDHIEVDVYVFFHETCEIEKVPNSKLFDVSSISAVACVAKGNTTFDGVKTGEYGTFLNKGATAGASLGLL